MQKDDGFYVGPRSVLDMARKARELVLGKDRAVFDADETPRRVFNQRVPVIGESARHVPAEYCAAHPEVPWPAIIGMRHRVVHECRAVADDVVWLKNQKTCLG